ncbi:MAG: dihydroorotate dehydrogenase [Candidatus Micrarchaeota archaeon]
MSIKTKFLGMEMKNPLILASGILGVTRAGLEEVCEKGAGAVTIKSLTKDERTGHKPPILAECDYGFLNAVGLSNPGIDEGIKEFSGWNRKEHLIMSITGKDANEFGQLAEKIEAARKGGSLKCSVLEAAVSCPHTPGYGTLAGQGTPEAVGEITKAIKSKTNLPLIVKLSPSSQGIGELAKAAEKNGADAINMGNTAGPGMVIDIERKTPVLTFKFGGMSGPQIKPLMIRCVYDIHLAVKIPILGTGGITYGKDAIEMMMAGASAIGVGTAVYYRGKEAFSQIANEMEKWMEEHGYSDYNEIIGAVHR